VEDAWSKEIETFSGRNRSIGREIYVKLSLLEINWTELACDSDKIVGFLFGSINKHYRVSEYLKSFVFRFGLFAKMLFRGFGKIEESHKFLYSLIISEMKYLTNRLSSDAEVEMFIVDSEYRRKGIGKKLMNSFVEAAKNADIKVITVYSETNSIWQFYEKYGFRKVATFYDNFLSYLNGKNISSILYALNL